MRERERKLSLINVNQRICASEYDAKIKLIPLY